MNNLWYKFIENTNSLPTYHLQIDFNIESIDVIANSNY